MTPIIIEPTLLDTKPSAYIQKDAVSMVGIDGEERHPWLDELDINDLLKLLEG